VLALATYYSIAEPSMIEDGVDSLTGMVLPEHWGFRQGERGTHTSRTIMLAELRLLMAATSAAATHNEYRQSIVEHNVLGKRTASTRKMSAQRLTELYALNPKVCLFRTLSRAWDTDPAGRPLLALLCAAARDPLLRMTAGTVLAAPVGTVVTTKDIEPALAEAAHGRFNASILNKIARNAGSSWTQSGHLVGRNNKKRMHPAVTPAATAYALFLGHLCGVRGQLLFSTFWAKLLDARFEQLSSLAFEASRRGWLNFRRAGSIIEVSFPGLLTRDEQRMLDEQDRLLVEKL